MLQVLLVCSRKGTAEEWNELNGQIEEGEGMDRVHRDGVGMGWGWGGGGVGGRRDESRIDKMERTEKGSRGLEKNGKSIDMTPNTKALFSVAQWLQTHTVRNSHLAGISQNLHLLSTFVAPEY